MAVIKTLIVEDSIFFRQFLKETLYAEFPNIEISEAVNGEEALQKVQKLLPHLVFMDIRLPGESGLELTKKIKADCPEMVIIILTSYDLPEYREAASKYGANYFLSKGSTTKEDILEVVKSILSNRDNDLNENSSKDQSK